MTARPRPSVDREIQRRLRVLVRSIGADINRIRTDAAASQAVVAREAGIDRSHVTRMEAGTTHPSLESLVAVATAMGADVSIRLYPGRGPRITDRHQARMVETILASLAPAWVPHLEVPVFRPARGFIDVVFEHRVDPRLVIAEAFSTLPRLEQQIRWSAEKAASIGSSDLVGDRPVPPVSRLLILRSTETTRALVRTFRSTMNAAYPASTREAVDSLRTGSLWPGDSIVWVRIEGDVVQLLDGVPRGIPVGRPG
ncbi:MAG TPA: helix-turn-helix transcriptional regulator [Candidatus Limnocylindrales bacterium]|nr:helix-turn-helix transcriptional regulator [Candidatus Limnocylindrales bacterium]